MLRKILIFVTLAALLSLLTFKSNGDVGFGFDILSIEYEDPETRNTVIITIEIYGMPLSIAKYEVELYDTQARIVRHSGEYNVSDARRFRLRLPNNLPAATYLITLNAKDETGEIVAGTSYDFNHEPIRAEVPMVGSIPAEAASNEPETSSPLPWIIPGAGLVVSIGALAGWQYQRTKRQNAAQLTAAKSTLNLPPNTIFISYSRDDWDDYVEPMVEHLRSLGLSIWVDQHLLKGGDDWMDRIGTALDQCAALVLCLSPTALDSRFVKMEYRYFFNNGKKIYPILCRPVPELPAELQIIQYYPYEQLDELAAILVAHYSNTAAVTS